MIATNCFGIVSLVLGIGFYTPSLAEVVSSKQLKNHVVFLTSKALAGRLTGTTGEKQAALYAANYFQSLGLEPAGDNSTFLQTLRWLLDILNVPIILSLYVLALR